LENIQEYFEAVAGIRRQLEDESISEIDFGEITGCLKTSESLVRRLSEAASGAETLRADYIGRIAGMVKAIAVVAPRKEACGAAVDYIETLGDMPAEGLVQEYQRVAARFRATFPSSFGLTSTATLHTAVGHDLSQFKQ
jgi:hypothetical protein